MVQKSLQKSPKNALFRGLGRPKIPANPSLLETVFPGTESPSNFSKSIWYLGKKTGLSGIYELEDRIDTKHKLTTYFYKFLILSWLFINEKILIHFDMILTITNDNYIY